MSESNFDKTEPEAVTLARAVLQAHYKEPVYPVSQVCEAVYTWAKCIQELNQQPQAQTGRSASDEGDYRQGKHYWEHLGSIRIDTSKSSLLGRLLYGREKLRTQPCLVHKGRWHGLGPRYDACGCDGTGWLSEPSAP